MRKYFGSDGCIIKVRTILTLFLLLLRRYAVLSSSKVPTVRVCLGMCASRPAFSFFITLRNSRCSKNQHTQRALFPRGCQFNNKHTTNICNDPRPCLPQATTPAVLHLRRNETSPKPPPHPLPPGQPSLRNTQPLPPPSFVGHITGIPRLPPRTTRVIGGSYGGCCQCRPRKCGGLYGVGGVDVLGMAARSSMLVRRDETVKMSEWRREDLCRSKKEGNKVLDQVVLYWEENSVVPLV